MPEPPDSAFQPIRIAVDTGGTFTDVVALGEDGSLRVFKVPSTPADPSEAILRGAALANPAAGFLLVHGTTVATNALLERRGAKTALLTTQGCRDVLEIARQTRDELYSLAPRPRRPLVPRALRLEVDERLDWQGQVVRSLDVASLEAALDGAKAAGAESLAVCFLFSFLAPDHEAEAGRRARARGFSVSLSSEVAPEYREYERTSTVCANAFVAPVMERYITELQQKAAAVGCGRLSIMQSNGGTLRAEEAAQNAVKTALSGPAGGLIAAARIAGEAGFPRLMTFDMGGTSTDVALVDGELRTMRSGEVAGLPLLTPMLDIHTVGAGGGSIARVDAGGALRVGPRSAGADPGPVAYGKGTEITVTDANLLLGRLPEAVKLAGSVDLDVERVRKHMTGLAAALNCSTEETALGIIDVVNANMARALRHISTERGYTPADYALVAFGGAGGLHACALAEALDIRTVLVPRYPGAFSALGLALADIRREKVRSFFAPAIEETAPLADTVFIGLRRAVREELRREGVTGHDVRIEPFVEARYTGQSYALPVSYRGSMAACVKAFHRAHKARYGHSDTSQPVEIVAVGVRAIGRSGVSLRPAELPERPGTALRSVRIYESSGPVECPVFHRDLLARGQSLAGPAIVVQEDSTTYVPTDWGGTVDDNANLLLRPA